MKFYQSCILVLFFICIIATSAAAGPLARLYITPGCIYINTGMQQQFKVTGLDSDDNVVKINEPVTWSADPAAGSITSNGFFTAGFISGRYMNAVKVTTSSGISAVAIVYVLNRVEKSGYILERIWGRYNPGQVLQPNKITIDANSNIYVSDSAAGTVQVFDTNGQYITQIGIDGNNNPQKFHPYSTTIAPNYIFVADNFIVYRFSLSGQYQKQWGDYNQFNGIRDIASDANNNVYVMDSGN